MRTLWLMSLMVFALPVGRWTPPPAAAADGLLEEAAAIERKASAWAVKEYGRALEARKAEVEKALAALKPAEVAPLPAEVVATGRDSGFVVFHRPSNLFIRRYTSPTPEQVKVQVLKITLARNEWEPVQVGIRALKDLKGFSYKVSDLIHSNGSDRIASGRCIRALYGYHLLAPKGRGSKSLVESPAALLSLPSIDIAAGQSQPLWIDVFAPAAAKGGTYTGQVSFRVGGREAGRAPLEVTVYPFVLDEARRWARGAFMGRHRTREELIQMREHGHNQVSWWTWASSVLTLENGKVVTDFPRYRKYLKLLDELGYTGPHAIFLGGETPKIVNRILKLMGRGQIGPGYGTAEAFRSADLSPPFFDHLIAALKQFHAQMKEVGHGDIPVCLLDEPDHRPRPARREWYIEFIKVVEEEVPELRLYGVFYHAGDEDRLSHKHAVWCTNRPAARIARVCRKAGKDLWTYHGGYAYTNTPTRGRFRFGIVPWVYAATGSYFWANHWHGGNVFDPFSVKGMSTVSLPTPHGPVATPILKGLREGIDDGRYLITLEDLIARARKSGDAAAKAEARKHLAFLDSFRGPLFENMGVRGGKPSLGKLKALTVTGVDGAKCDIRDQWKFSEFLRRDVARRIVSLMEKVK